MQPLYVGLLVGGSVITVVAICGALLFIHIRRKAKLKVVRDQIPKYEDNEKLDNLKKTTTTIKNRDGNIKFSAPIHLATLKIKPLDESKHNTSKSILMLKVDDPQFDLNSDCASKGADKTVRMIKSSQNLRVYANPSPDMSQDAAQSHKSFESMCAINPQSPEKSLTQSRRHQFEKQSLLNMNEEFYMNYISKRFSPKKEKIHKQVISRYARKVQVLQKKK